ncbi:hypothetical protein AHAS_Ahas14G0213500 [Arachis hypogaea]
MTKKLSRLEFERFAVDDDHHPEFMLRSTWTIVGVADSATTASFQVRNNRRASFQVRDIRLRVGGYRRQRRLRSECCQFEMESHGEGSSNFSVQWTDGWSTDLTDDDEGSAAWSLETEQVQSAAGDREDGSVAGDEGSMPVPTGIHVAADTEYGDEELGSAVLTAAALESAEYNSVEEAYKA